MDRYHRIEHKRHMEHGKKCSNIIISGVQERELSKSKAEAIFKDIMVNNFIKLTKGNQATYSKAL